MNLEKINQMQLEKIKRIIIELDASGIVRRARVFGSSVTDECTKDSDVDICLELNCSTRDMRLYDLSVKIDEICDYDCDLLVYDRLIEGSPIWNEIENKGVDIYVSKAS